MGLQSPPQPTPFTISKFLDTCHPFSTPKDTDVHNISISLPCTQRSHFWANIIARNVYDVNPTKARYTFVSDSGANRHMCHDKALFIKMCAYTGATQHVTLGDGKTTQPICGVGTIEFTTSLGHTIRLHNVVYVPGLNVSLYSINQHMKYEGCYEHSEYNSCRLAFPSFILPVDNNDELEFKVQPSTKSPSIKPDFDEATAPIYTAEKPKSLFFDRPDHDSLLEVTISSSQRTKSISFPPKRATQTSIGYDLFAPSNTSVDPNTRKAIPLGLNMSIPPGLYGRIAPRYNLSTHDNIDIAGGVIDPDYNKEIRVVIVNSSQKRFTILKGDAIAQVIFERAATPAIRLLSSLNIVRSEPRGVNITNPISRKQLCASSL